MAQLFSLGGIKRMSDTSDIDKIKKASGARLIFSWLGVLFCIYLLPLIVILIDEGILHTNWIYNHSPAWLVDTIRAVYPIGQFLNR